MRQHYDTQHPFDSTPIGQLMLNYDCRDEIIPVLAGLQYVYTSGPLRNLVVRLVAEDIYALYLPTGGTVTIQLPANAEYEFAWWDPSNGSRGQFEAGGRVHGGQQSFTSPSQGDWALRVLRSKP